ncbi:MAG TPA: TRAP transporter substrate-binding protein DctP [Stellaceae bacterium]|jgi:TRAP-type C4-dicarboxylate transport system substrate-binding protein
MKLIYALLGIALTSAVGATIAAADEVKLTFVTLAPPDSRVAKTEFHPWAERINAAGKGIVQLDVRDGFTLANMDNVYSRVMDDVVQIGWGTQNAIGGKFIRSALAGLPFVSGDCSTASTAFWRLYQSGALNAEYADIVPLMLIVFPQSGIHLVHPVAKLEDLRGLKLIALGKVQSEAVTALGGAPLSIPLTDMYQALQRGTADGAVASWTVFDPFRLGDVTRYHAESRLGTSTGMIFMAKKKFNALPAAAQKVLKDNSGEVASRAFGAYLDGDAARVRDNVKTAPQQVLTAPDATRAAAWRDKLAKVDADYVNTVPSGQAILDSYRQLLAAAKAN